MRPSLLNGRAPRSFPSSRMSLSVIPALNRIAEIAVERGTLDHHSRLLV